MIHFVIVYKMACIYFSVWVTLILLKNTVKASVDLKPFNYQQNSILKRWVTMPFLSLCTKTHCQRYIHKNENNAQNSYLKKKTKHVSGYLTCENRLNHRIFMYIVCIKCREYFNNCCIFMNADCLLLTFTIRTIGCLPCWLSDNRLDIELHNAQSPHPP